jgi:endonuclease III
VPRQQTTAGTSALLAKQKQVARVIRLLEREYPEADCELNFSNAYELLVATMLSAQCTDVKVNEVTPELFATFPDPASLAAADRDAVERIIKPTGFFRQKAQSLQGMAQQVCDTFGGEVPDTVEGLVTLPGVGRKTANVVLGYAFGIPGITVDTHVGRLARRLGWTTQENPEKVEAELMALWPKREWTALSQLLIWHGRRCCHARKPACGSCVIADLCPSANAVMP